MRRSSNGRWFITRTLMSPSRLLRLSVAVALLVVKAECDVNECGSDICQNDRNCSDSGTANNCTCPSGFTGAMCETELSKCASAPCQNGGSCSGSASSYQCACPSGFTGVNCEKDANLARGRPTWQSSTRENSPSNLAVDGNRDSSFWGGSCTHTTEGDVNPWWAVDLGRPTNVGKVVFYNRQDCCAERANDFIVGLTNESPDTQKPSVRNYNLCGQHMGAAGPVETVVCSSASQAARYVIVQLNRRGILTICELEVYERIRSCDYNCHLCNRVEPEMCDACNNGFHLTSNWTCERCADNCHSCTRAGPGRCDQCDNPFALTSNLTCERCAANCDSCTRHGPGRCDYCDGAFALTSNLTCEPCDPHCQTGGCHEHGPGKCDGKCKSSYGLTSNDTCAPCADNCRTCDRKEAPTCDECGNGFGLTSSETCEPCADNCHLCSTKGAAKCDECDGGFGPTLNETCALCDPKCAFGACRRHGPGTCDHEWCDLGYGITSDHSCAPCADNCHLCWEAGAAKCDVCHDGFALTLNETCEACDPNCTSGGCDAHGAGKCDGSCASGYVLTTNHTCALACDSNCAAGGCDTSGSGTCDGTCVPGYVLTSNHTCEPICDANCASGGCNARGQGKCDGACKSGFGLISDRSCALCDPNCVSGGCDTHGAGKCDGVCAPGYDLTSSHSCAGNCVILWMSIDNTNRPGGEPVNATTVAECKLACLSASRCTGIDWYRDTPSCKLSGNGAWNIGTANDVTHYHLQQRCNGNCSIVWVPFDNTSVSGRIFRLAMSVVDCKLACLNTSDCTGIDWDPHNPDNAKCRLSDDGRWTNETATGVTHYHRQHKCIAMSTSPATSYGSSSVLVDTISVVLPVVVLLIVIVCVVVYIKRQLKAKSTTAIRGEQRRLPVVTKEDDEGYDVANGDHFVRYTNSVTAGRHPCIELNVNTHEKKSYRLTSAHSASYDIPDGHCGRDYMKLHEETLDGGLP